MILRPAPPAVLLAGALLAGALGLTGCGGTSAAPHRTGTASAGTATAGPVWFAGCPTPTGPVVSGRGALPATSVPCFTGGRSVPLNRPYGRPTVINLWASWCAPCRQELPEVARYAAAHRDVLVLTVDTRDSRSAGLAFARDAKVRLPTLFDPDRRVLTGVGRTALPVTLLVGADGRLAYTYNSTALTASGLDALVTRYLRGDR